MSQGQIVEQGTHKQLCALQGIVAELWRMEAGLSEVDTRNLEYLDMAPGSINLPPVHLDGVWV